MIFLSLNCQGAFHPDLEKFLNQVLEGKRYDFLVLQEVTDNVLKHLNNASYELLTAHNEEAGSRSHLAIVYRKSIKLLDSKLVSIEQFNEEHSKRKSPTHGLLYGDFMSGEHRIRTGSIHLHSGINQKARSDSLGYVQEVLYSSEATTVMGGDYNFGPFEKKHGIKQMSPLFVCVTHNLGKTLNSRYTEPGTEITNRIAVLMSKLGFGLSFATDHFFVNKKAAAKPHATKILPDRVSDHSPIELVIEN